MIEELEHLVDDVKTLNSKLILLIGPPGSEKSNLLARLSERRDSPILNVGTSLGRRLLAIPNTSRHLQAADLMRELADGTARQGMLLMDNIELLFDRSLQLNPLSLLQRLAHARPVIAVWPGQLREGRLSYAATEHPEHQDYGIDGLVPFEIH